MAATIETPVIVALVGAGASLLVAFYSQYQARATSARLAEFELERDEERARRDYEYEARKRLYTECEPLLFQASELAALARSRVPSIARTARGANLLADGQGWLARPGYYLQSTAYMLLGPATIFRLLQRRLTVIDLRLEPRLRIQYELLKLLFLSFNDDFELARHAPQLAYEPDRTDPEEPHRDRLLRDAPQRYARQGLYRGVLDIVVEALVIEGADDTARVMTFGEFLRAWENPDSPVHGTRETLLELLTGFHPARKPVLWRMLLAQYMLYTVLLRDDDPLAAPLDAPSAEDLAVFDWRRPDIDHDSDAEISSPMLAAHEYVREKLDGLAARLQGPTAL